MPFSPAPASLLRALSERGYAEPTPVQAAVLQSENADRDLLVSAQTGSGKTVAYGLALGSTLLGDAERLAPGGAPVALVIAPTRELALQVQRELEWLYQPAGGRVLACVGGMDARREQRLLAAGCHIVVGTPGRLRDHIERGQLDLSALRAVVLDEADEMLDLGFREDLEAILDAAPTERRTLLFSATLPKEIIALARRFQHDAQRIAMSSRDEPHRDIEYRAMPVAPHEAERAVVNILRFFEASGAIVFCSTREAVRRLQGNLLERGFAVAALSGELSQVERNRALQALRDGRARVCVATDVAARGLDLPDLGLVIHAELPRDGEVLQHRSGRTGRAGRKGVSVVLVPYNRRHQAERLLGAARIEAVWSPPPAADEIRARDQARLAQDTILAEPATEEDLAGARALLAERSAEDLAVALVRLHRSLLPAPEELSPPPERAASAERRPSRPSQEGGDESVWFRMNVGRANNADPRWLLPFLCRRGHVTKAEIGRIEIAERQSRVEIARHAAGRFASSIRRPDSQDRHIRIEEDRPHRPSPKHSAPRAKPPRH
ncbi:DEAD/DEAH box helicase [Inquilinus sp.]|jgi:ATP-dependent RNA helicase DeaD|uniref:DEAD/DEAH box helicase n=1 Tax=Inquilinus sp. TaxID=1932117 RepID=UPI0037838A5C